MLLGWRLLLLGLLTVAVQVTVRIVSRNGRARESLCYDGQSVLVLFYGRQSAASGKVLSGRGRRRGEGSEVAIGRTVDTIDTFQRTTTTVANFGNGILGETAGRGVRSTALGATAYS